MTIKSYYRDFQEQLRRNQELKDILKNVQNERDEALLLMEKVLKLEEPAANDMAREAPESPNHSLLQEMARELPFLSWKDTGAEVIGSLYGGALLSVDPNYPDIFLAHTRNGGAPSPGGQHLVKFAWAVHAGANKFHGLRTHLHAYGYYNNVPLPPEDLQVEAETRSRDGDHCTVVFTVHYGWGLLEHTAYDALSWVRALRCQRVARPRCIEQVLQLYGGVFGPGAQVDGEFIRHRGVRSHLHAPGIANWLVSDSEISCYCVGGGGTEVRSDYRGAILSLYDQALNA